MQCLDSLVESSNFSDATLGDGSRNAMTQLLGILHARVEDSRPTVRRAAMKLIQTVIHRNPVGDELDLYSAQARLDAAGLQLQAAEEAASKAVVALEVLMQSDAGDIPRQQLHNGMNDVPCRAVIFLLSKPTLLPCSGCAVMSDVDARIQGFLMPWIVPFKGEKTFLHWLTLVRLAMELIYKKRCSMHSETRMRKNSRRI